MIEACTLDRCQGCPTRLVCRCLQVTEEQLVRTITFLGLRTVKEVKAMTGAGDGCTCCHSQIEAIIEENAYASAM